MKIVPGHALLLKLPYADGGPADKRRPFLVIDVNDKEISMLNVSSVMGKPRSLMYPFNKLILNYDPPFRVLSFVKLNSLYVIEYLQELEDHAILHNGQTLCDRELKNIIDSFSNYQQAHNVDRVYYDRYVIEQYNSIYFAKQAIASTIIEI